MSVDIEIYMSNIQKFFKDNPKDLMNLVPKEKENDFYVMIREVAEQNFEKNGEAGLTRNQLLDICKELNTPKEQPKTSKVIIMTPYGGYSLN